MSSIVEPRAPEPLPSVTVQIARGALAAGVLVLVAILVTAATTGRQPWAGERWAQLFGDPQMTLAPGVVPPDAAATSSIVTVDPGVLHLGTSTVALERAFGSPVRELPREADAPAAYHRYSTPIGTVSFLLAPAGQTTVIVVRGGSQAPVATTAAARRAVIERISRGIGFTAAGAPAGVSLALREQHRDLGGTVVQVSMTSGGHLVGYGAVGPEQYAFDAQGRFVNALMSGAPAVSVESADVPSAASAWDDLRHHRATADGGWGPITATEFDVVAGTRIVGGDLSVPPLWMVAYGGVQSAIYPVQP